MKRVNRTVLDWLRWRRPIQTSSDLYHQKPRRFAHWFNGLERRRVHRLLKQRGLPSSNLESMYGRPVGRTTRFR